MFGIYNWLSTKLLPFSFVFFFVPHFVITQCLLFFCLWKIAFVGGSQKNFQENLNEFINISFIFSPSIHWNSLKFKNLNVVNIINCKN